MMITAEYVRQLLEYDPATGIFRWKRRERKHFTSDHQFNAFNAHYAGKHAGTIDNGYVRVNLSGRNSGGRVRAHRLAWLYCYGRWPTNKLDHKNTNRSDNRIGNLREATNAQNLCNRGVQSDSKTGIKGVSFHKPSGKWVAQITATGWGRMSLGLHESPELAAISYQIAASYLHGEFARAA